jgi:RND superfamily putative drug exporter
LPGGQQTLPTGSIVVPIKALVLNLLMLSAVLGTMVWIFQDGHLAPILGVTPAPLNLSMVVLLCCIAFSLSVDYEIFLLSRIKEARDAGLSNNDAIVVGHGRVGRISAAPRSCSQSRCCPSPTGCPS